MAYYYLLTAISIVTTPFGSGRSGILADYRVHPSLAGHHHEAVAFQAA